jgi:hypothetical protein
MRNPAIFTPALAREWTQAWQQLAGDAPALKIPLRMMETCVRFLETNERNVLLDLPMEQRSLLEPEIDFYLRASGKVRDEIDLEIDSLIRAIRKQSPKPVA